MRMKNNMAQVIININNREYAILCENGQEGHIIRLSRQLDEKAKSLVAALGHVNENHLLAMVGLLMADELSEEKKKNSGDVSVASNAIMGASNEELNLLDEELSKNINSLNDLIKSVASNLKSV